jgi:hypothetical protein
MSLKWSAFEDFWDYVEFYPESDEEGYDGIHSGGIKGLVKDAPEKAKEAYEKFRKMEEEAKKQGIKL